MCSSDLGKDDDKVEVHGDNWTCEIEKMGQGVFKVRMTWAVSEPVTRAQPARRPRSWKKKNAEAAA